MINLFFSNGIISTLSSVLVARHISSNDSRCINILCIEKNNHVKEEYYNIVNIILFSSNFFDSIIYIDDISFKNISKFHVFKSWLAVKYYKKKSELLINKINKLGYNVKQINQIFFPTSSKLWPFFRKGSSLNVIEHGLGEYILARNQSDKLFLCGDKIKKIINSLFFRVLNYSEVKEVYTSEKTKKWLICKDPCVKNATIKFTYESQFIYELMDDFFVKLEQFESKSYQTLLTNYNDFLLFNNKYIYVASDEIDYNRYSEFVENQFQNTKISKNIENNVFVIKKHPGALELKYSNFLKKYGHIIELEDPILVYIPLEFLVYFFSKLSKVEVIGSLSSSFLYIREFFSELKIHQYFDSKDYYLYEIDDAKKFYTKQEGKL